MNINRKMIQPEVRRQVQKLRDAIDDKALFTSEQYHTSLLKLTKTLGQKQSVKLILEYSDNPDGEVAFTDGRRVYLNTGNQITAQFPTRKERVESHEGLIAHECGHICCTDFNRRTTYVRGFKKGQIYPTLPAGGTKTEKRNIQEMAAYVRRKDPIAVAVIGKTAAYLSNILEDVYIESKMCQRYPGSVRSTIQKNAEALLSEIPVESERKGKESDNLTIMMDLILRYARSGVTAAEDEYSRRFIHCLDTCRNGIDEAVSNENPDIRYHIANALMVKLWRYMKQSMEKVRKELNKEIKSLTMEELEKRIQEYLKKQCFWYILSSCSDTEDGNEVVIDGWDGIGGQSQMPLENKTGTRESFEKLDAFRKNQSGDQEYDQLLNADDDLNLVEQISEILNEMAEKDYVQQAEKNLKKELSVELKNLDLNDVHKGCNMKIHREEPNNKAHTAYEALRPEIKRVSKRLKRSVEDLLERQEGGRLTGLYMGKRLNRGNLYRQDGKIFEKKIVPEDDFSVAFAVLVDQSASMSDENRIDYARKASLILYDFCKMLSIPVMVYGHNTRGSGLGGEQVNLYSYAEFDSVDGMDHLRITSMSSGGCNRDGAALQFVGEHLLKRDEEFKILVLISDGEPNAYGYKSEYAKADLQKIKRNLEKKGVRLFAAAIGDDRPQIESIYENGFLNISDLNTMPQKLAGLITAHIR
ncbi:MAG: VWA domain-containing protein [Monoglobales bacterium]